jgi:hypothetical protein
VGDQGVVGNVNAHGSNLSPPNYFENRFDRVWP